MNAENTLTEGGIAMLDICRKAWEEHKDSYAEFLRTLDFDINSDFNITSIAEGIGTHFLKPALSVSRIDFRCSDLGEFIVYTYFPKVKNADIKDVFMSSISTGDIEDNRLQSQLAFDIYIGDISDADYEIIMKLSYSLLDRMVRPFAETRNSVNNSAR